MVCTAWAMIRVSKRNKNATMHSLRSNIVRDITGSGALNQKTGIGGFSISMMTLFAPKRDGIRYRLRRLCTPILLQSVRYFAIGLCDFTEVGEGDK